MKRLVFIGAIAGFLALSGGVARSQEIIVTGFPVGKAGSVDQSLFEPYYPALSALADTLRVYPMARAVVTGGADGKRFGHNNDALNPALALGRAHALRRLLIQRFDVDSTQIIMTTESDSLQGPRYRYAAVRLVRDLADFETRLNAVEQRPPVKERFIPRVDTVNVVTDDYVLHVGAGLATSPFGGIPVVTGGLTWKRTIAFEAILGHTFWNGEYPFQGNNLDTRRRLAGGYLIVYPSPGLRLGVVGGWIRIEDIAEDYYRYVRLSEGPVLGLRATPFDFLAVTGVFNPSKRSTAEDLISRANNDQFFLSVTAYLEFGGGR
jgi:hypothetical protein